MKKNSHVCGWPCFYGWHWASWMQHAFADWCIIHFDNPTIRKYDWCCRSHIKKVLLCNLNIYRRLKKIYVGHRQWHPMTGMKTDHMRKHWHLTGEGVKWSMLLVSQHTDNWDLTTPPALHHTVAFPCGQAIILGGVTSLVSVGEISQMKSLFQS